MAHEPCVDFATIAGNLEAALRDYGRVRPTVAAEIRHRVEEMKVVFDNLTQHGYNITHINQTMKNYNLYVRLAMIPYDGEMGMSVVLEAYMELKQAMRASTVGVTWKNKSTERDEKKCWDALQATHKVLLAEMAEMQSAAGTQTANNGTWALITNRPSPSRARPAHASASHRR